MLGATRRRKEPLAEAEQDRFVKRLPETVGCIVVVRNHHVVCMSEKNMPSAVGQGVVERK